MQLRAFSTLLLSLGLSTGLVACDKKETPPASTVEQAQTIADNTKDNLAKAGEAAAAAGDKIGAAADKAVDKAGEAAAAVGDKVEVVVDKANAAAAEAKADLAAAADKAQEAAEAAGEKLGEAVDKAQEAAGEAKANLEAAADKVGDAVAAAVATLNATAPDFTLKDLKGNPIKLSDYRGKIVVLEWFNPECPFVVRHYTTGALKEQAKQAGDKVVWLTINSGAPGKQGAGVELNTAKAAEYGIVNPVLIDEDGAVGRLYQARNTPHMYVIDADGKLVYAGAIDNAPQGEAPAEGYINYVAEALKALAEGKPVAISETKAYGCSVKYAD